MINSWEIAPVPIIPNLSMVFFLMNLMLDGHKEQVRQGELLGLGIVLDEFAFLLGDLEGEFFVTATTGGWATTSIFL